MRRLAAVTVGATILLGIGPATAGTGRDSGRQSWCAENSTVMVNVVGGGHVELVAGVGVTSDKPVQSAFACTEGQVGRHHLDALVTAWLDSEDGRAGMSCARRLEPEAITCKRRTVPLPGHSTERPDSTHNEWVVDLLGVGIAYEIGHTTAASTRTPRTCMEDVCTDEGQYRAWARPGAPPDEQSAARSGDEEEPAAGVQDTTVTVPVDDVPAG